MPRGLTIPIVTTATRLVFTDWSLNVTGWRSYGDLRFLLISILKHLTNGFNGIGSLVVGGLSVEFIQRRFEIR